MDALMKVHTVTIDSGDPWALAAFWSQLVGGTPADAGNGFVLVKPATGIRLLFQQTDRASRDPGWIHLDCATVDRERTIEAVVRLGGRLVEHRGDSNGNWTVLSDPEGNLFCI